MYLDWAAAVTRALDTGDKQMRLQLSNSSTWEQSVGGPQKYHRKALKQLRIKFGSVPVATKGQLELILRRCGCLDHLKDQSNL